MAAVLATLQGKSPILGILPFAPAQAESVEAGAKLFEPLLKRGRTMFFAAARNDAADFAAVDRLGLEVLA